MSDYHRFEVQKVTNDDKLNQLIYDSMECDNLSLCKVMHYLYKDKYTCHDNKWYVKINKDSEEEETTNPFNEEWSELIDLFRKAKIMYYKYDKFTVCYYANIINKINRFKNNDNKASLIILYKNYEKL